MTRASFRGLQGLVQALFANANDVVVVAPFIKHRTLSEILSGTPATSVRVFTRWRAEEIAMGVSDLEVFDLVYGQGGELMLIDQLHAKYYRGDSDILLGSANVTAKGLSYPRGNLELLMQAEYDDEFRQFETELVELAYLATPELRDEMAEASEKLDLRKIEEGAPSDAWVPNTRDPADLWKAYSGQLERLSSAAQTAASTDLEFLALPAGLTQSQFESTLRTRLYGVALLRRIDDFAVKSRRFGEMRDFLARQSELSGNEAQASHVWQTIFRWLLYFMPDRYRAWEANHSEIFERRSDS